MSPVRTMSPERATPEPTELEKMLHLQGGAFVKRSERSGGYIDSGWSVINVGESESGRRVVVLNKQDAEGNTLLRHVPEAELVRLNTGRNRKALEYLSTLPDENLRRRLTEAVDRADTDERARSKLQDFFKTEALRRARELFDQMRAKGADIAPLEARTTEELALYIKQVEQWQFEPVDQVVQMAKEQLKQEQAKKSPDPEKIAEYEANLKTAMKRRYRDVEKPWEAKIAPLLSLIDLAQEWTK